MSSENSSNTWLSLERRSIGIPILELLTRSNNLTFGKLMESLKISKKGLYLALLDLERDGLIKRSRRGKYTYVRITSEGKQALLSYLSLEENTKSLVDQILDGTINQLEKEGILSSDWDDMKRREFISKLKQTLEEQMKRNNIE